MAVDLNSNSDKLCYDGKTTIVYHIPTDRRSDTIDATRMHV